jgi:hypothetical protein
LVELKKAKAQAIKGCVITVEDAVAYLDVNELRKLDHYRIKAIRKKEKYVQKKD